MVGAIQRDAGDEYVTRLQAADAPVDHTCWPGMVHELASIVGIVDAEKELIDQTAAALRTAFGPSAGERRGSSSAD